VNEPAATVVIASAIAELVGSSTFIANAPWSDGDSAQVADWLHLAAGVENVGLDRARKLDDFGFCRGADQWELARDAALAVSVTELARFLFVWGGLETAISAIDPPVDLARPGKINAACQLIRGTYGDSPLRGVTSLLASLEKDADQWGGDSVGARFGRLAEYGRSAIGLHVVYGLRNRLAHGSLRLPGHEEGEAVARTIQTCSTLTLLSLQMLLSAALRRQETFDVWSLEFGECDVHFLLNNLHLHEDEP